MYHLPIQQEKFTPVKYFSIDRVFRNETLDATHLAEFHQIEGVVADYGLTLGDLMGILHQFFTKLGQKGRVNSKWPHNMAEWLRVNCEYINPNQSKFYLYCANLQKKVVLCRL